MYFNRFRSAVPSRRLADPSPSPTAFVLCPQTGLPTASPAQYHWRQNLYELALEQARAVVRPSLPERDLLAVWN